MKRHKLNAQYWENNYLINKIGWDIGYASPPIIKFFEKIEDKSLAILIPGAGNSYEAEVLFDMGFENITVLDYAAQPLKNILDRIPDFPKDNLIQDDFFNHNKKYDIIIEQTFFCALNPDLRSVYVDHMHKLLHNNGYIIGLLFNFPLSNDGPPYGGSIKEYKNLFSKKFNIKFLEPCFNSIKPRDGMELFIIFEKK